MENNKTELESEVNKRDILDQIEILTQVVKANSGFLGSEDTKYQANKKIQQLIKLL